MIPGSSLSAYIARVNSIPILTEEREKELTERLFYQNDVEAARELILSHLRFVVHIARSYWGYGLPHEEIIQEGNVGLMKAVDRFDPTRGVRLVTYAVQWIKAEIHEFLLKNWRLVRVATTKAQRKLFYNRKKLHSNEGRALNTEEKSAIARELGVKVSDVAEMERRLQHEEISLEQTRDSDEDSSTISIDSFASSEGDPAEIVAETELQEKIQSCLQKAIAQLSDRDREIIQSRYMPADGKKVTLSELGTKYNVSAERIRQLEESAIYTLREYLQPLIGSAANLI